MISSANRLVCTDLAPYQAPSDLLAQAGIEAPDRQLLLGGPPTIDEIGPKDLPVSGGPLLLSGTGFSPSSTVYFGGQRATSVTVLSANYVIAVAPPGSGTVDVTLTTAGGTSQATAAAAVTRQSVPLPCLPVVGGGFSSALVP